MIAVLFPLFALFGVFACTLRSLGWGMLALLAVGYLNGIVRANFLSSYTTFMFDCGLLGLYIGFFAGRSRDSAGIWKTPLGRWTMLLIAWPSLMVLVPLNDMLVQLVALRATVWFLPVMLVASRMRADDLNTLARGLAVLNFVAFAVGVYIYENGIASLYPDNAVTQMMYRSKDIGGNEFYRIPSTFLNAHAYGGTMLFSLPFLLDRAFGRGARVFDRGLAAAGVVAGIAGILMCAARQPAVVLILTTLIVWAMTRFNPVVGLVAVALLGAAIYTATSNERLQRVTSMEDTEAVSERVKGSANDSFFDLMLEYPAGAGMGSSVGTSVPYFLADRAPLAVGLENEYCRILIDQGLVGLGLWFFFLGWLYHRPPPLRLDAPWGLGAIIMYSLTATNWATAFLGTGTLSSIPGSVMLLAQMGILVRIRNVTSTGRP